MKTGVRSEHIPVWYGKIRFNMVHVLYISYLHVSIQYRRQNMHFTIQYGVTRYGTDTPQLCISVRYGPLCK